MPPDVVEQLFSRTADGVRPGLDVERALLERLDTPQEAYRTIHVAGTNGKGSVCAMTASMLTQAGLKTGLYTSPHLVRFNERFQVDGRCIDDDALADMIRCVEAVDAELMAAKATARRATFFELSTAMAFLYFRQQQVDVAVIETGMGGRWDATNVICPVVTALTDISIDHTHYLGATLAGIAAEKCGIIKAHTPVVCARMEEALLEMIRTAAAARKAPVTVADERVRCAWGPGPDGEAAMLHCEVDGVALAPCALPLAGPHQAANARLALALTDAFARRAGIQVTPGAMCRGLEGVEWPGRCQLLCADPLVFLDGAHNPAGMRAVISHMRSFKRPLALVFGVLVDKDVDAMIAMFADDVRCCRVVPLSSDRAMAPEEIGTRLARHGVEYEIEPLECGLTSAMEWARACGGMVLVAGSLYLVGEVLADKNRWFMN